MSKSELIQEIKSKKSLLCVGLDTEIQKLPKGVSKDIKGVIEFNKEIIKATLPFAISYKINTAFYEQYGKEGWMAMEETLNAIPNRCFKIADAKRGDIGNTSHMYAKAFFETLNFDAITVAPYMGVDSLEPFFSYPGKWVICLGITSNSGHEDFQNLIIDEEPLYAHVIKKVSMWGSTDNLMFVVGATRGSLISEARTLAPNHFFLVPGIGAQGGSLEEVCKRGINSEYGLIINASRSLLYASQDEDYAMAAHDAAKKLIEEMRTLISF